MIHWHVVIILRNWRGFQIFARTIHQKRCGEGSFMIIIPRPKTLICSTGDWLLTGPKIITRLILFLVFTQKNILSRDLVITGVPGVMLPLILPWLKDWRFPITKNW